MKISTIFAPLQPVKKFAFERPFTAFLSGAILLLAFFFIRQALTPKAIDTASEKEATMKQVSVFEIGKDTPTGTVIGTLNREHVSTVTATVSGVIDRISVKEGSFVSGGTSLVHIAPSAAATARELAEAQLSVTEKTRVTEQKILELNKRISESETTSGRKEDLARENKKVAQANLDLKRIAAKLNVDIAKSGEQSFAPFAPFSGKIEALFVSKGDIVTPGMKIATVIGSTPKSVIRAEIPSSLALSINPSGRHIATTPSGEKVPLTLNHLSASAISANAFQATFSIADTEASVLGDTSILVITIALQSVGNTFIPLSSVEITRNSVTTVIIRDGKAKQIAVIPGQTLGNFIEITDGLASGDRIILDRSIREGDAIEIK